MQVGGKTRITLLENLEGFIKEFRGLHRVHHETSSPPQRREVRYSFEVSLTN